MRQPLLIGGFQKTRSRFPMDLDRTADCPVRLPATSHPSCPFVLFVVKPGRFLLADPDSSVVAGTISTPSEAGGRARQGSSSPGCFGGCAEDAQYGIVLVP